MTDAPHYKGDGKIYGGEPVLLKSTSVEEKKAEAAAAAPAGPTTKKIAKFSWSDEDAKVRIYIDTDQFNGEIEESSVDV